MEYIQVRINEDGTLRNQRFAFSDRFTLITELLQNGRRAGATLIEISHDPVSQTLRVIDDGRGIDDFSKLLTFNESGWDETLQAEEHPFGAGFSRCLYASPRALRRDWRCTSRRTSRHGRCSARAISSNS